METKFTPENLIRWVVTLAVILAVFFVLRYLSGVLLPFCIAWFFAYLLYPIVRFVQNRLHVRVRFLATIITLLLTIAVITGIVWLIIPPMIEQFESLGTIVSGYVARQTNTGGVVQVVHDFLRDNEDGLRKLLEGEEFKDAAKAVVPKMFTVLGHTANVVISICASCIVILYMFFILQDYENLSTNWVRIFPVKARPFWRRCSIDMERALNAYIRGQGTVALCMGIMFCIGFTIIDFPMAIGLGILIGILDLVPYLHTFALIPTALLALLKAADTGQNFWIIFASAVAIFIIVQIITDFVTVPKIMGRAMGLNPAVLLLALSVWGTLLGFIGLILALPLTTLIIAYWKRYVTKEEVDRPATEEEIKT